VIKVIHTRRAFSYYVALHDRLDSPLPALFMSHKIIHFCNLKEPTSLKQNLINHIEEKGREEQSLTLTFGAMCMKC